MAPTQSHDPNPSEMMGSAQGGRRYTSEVPSHPSHGNGKKAAPAISVCHLSVAGSSVTLSEIFDH